MEALPFDVSTGDTYPGFCDSVSLSSADSGCCWCTEYLPVWQLSARGHQSARESCSCLISRWQIELKEVESSHSCLFMLFFSLLLSWVHKLSYRSYYRNIRCLLVGWEVAHSLYGRDVVSFKMWFTKWKSLCKGSCLCSALSWTGSHITNTTTIGSISREVNKLADPSYSFQISLYCEM